MISQTSNDDALLSEPSNDSLLSDDSLPSDHSLLKQGGDDVLLSGVEDEQDLLLDSRAKTDGSASPQLTKLRGSQHVAAGGWYLDHELLALRYMPRGHADTTLAAWAEFMARLDGISAQATEPTETTGRLEGTQPHVTAAAVLSQLTLGAAIPGGCMQCHLLPSGNSSPNSTLGPSSNWTSLTRSSGIRPFTKFDHTAHLSLPTLADCRYCHQFNDQQTTSLQAVIAENKGRTPTSSTHQQWTQAACQFLRDEFIDMRVEQCSACHRADGASDDCTGCHNYHVGTSGMNWSK